MSHSLPYCISNYHKIPYIEQLLIIPLIMLLFLPVIIIIYLVCVISAYIINAIT